MLDSETRKVFHNVADKVLNDLGWTGSSSRKDVENGVEVHILNPETQKAAAFVILSNHRFLVKNSDLNEKDERIYQTFYRRSEAVNLLSAILEISV